MTSEKRLIYIDGEISKQDVQILNKCLNVLFDFFNLDSAEVSIRLSDDLEIQALNSQYRGLDKPTDVLSFPAPPEIDSLGDVIISIPIAEKQATAHGHALIYEICYLCVHGVLHLLGYEDETEEGYIKMNDLLQKIIKDSHIPVHTTWHSIPYQVLGKES